MKLSGCFCLGLVSVAACAATPPAKAPASTQTTAAAPNAAIAEEPASEGGEGAAVCDLVCERARVQRRASDDPDYHAQATENANRVIGAMHSDLLACYRRRVNVNPAAHGFITVDIVIGPDGRVILVETTGGAVLGKGTMDCMVRRIEKGVFAPPHGGGTLRIQVPFSLRRLAPDEET
jgi:hypothetical protein